MLTKYVAFVLAVLALGCSQSSATCRAGEQVACACVGGAAGAQTCNDDGSKFLACQCPMTAASDSGTAPTDAGGGLADAGSPRDAGAAVDGGPTTRVVLNWCDGGCTVHPGADNISLGQSSVVSTTSTLSENTFDSVTRASIVACVQSKFAAYNIFIDDHASSAVHREILLAGTPGQLGFPSGVSNVSPTNCAGIENAYGFVFTGTLNNDVAAACNVTALSIAELLGLDHELSCPDLTSYLTGCGAKSFTDVDAGCGETTARACACGPSQNSHQLLLERLHAHP